MKLLIPTKPITPFTGVPKYASTALPAIPYAIRDGVRFHTKGFESLLVGIAPRVVEARWV